MQELKIDSQIAVLRANFEEVKSSLVENLKKYDIEVTSDTVKEAKKQATELNKLADEIKKRGKAVIDEQMQPIDAFKSGINELFTLCKDSRSKITDQVRVFEDAYKLEVLTKIQHYKQLASDLIGLRQEYSTLVDVSVAVSLTSLTSKNELNKATKEKVDLALSNAYNVQLQNDSEKAKLEAVAKEAEAKRTAELEKAKAQAREEAIQEERERERKANIERENRERKQREDYSLSGTATFTNAVRIAVAKEAEAKRTAELEKAKAQANGKSTYLVTLTYEVRARSGVDGDLIVEKSIDSFYNRSISIKNSSAVEL
jgi:hypothetical protein